MNLVCLLLDWLCYSSQSSKPNESAKLFGRKNKRLLVGLLITLLELPTLPLQWPELVLARAFIGALISLVKKKLN